jgi:hypothetical protein
MEHLELLIGLLAAVAVVVRLAGRTGIPEPVLLVLAGLAGALRRLRGRDARPAGGAGEL